MFKIKGRAKEENYNSGGSSHSPSSASDEPYGIFYVANKVPTPEQTIDVVAIHGLGGHYENTWTHSKTKKNWLRDFLPDQMPEFRVMSWGYNARVLGSKSVGTVKHFARSLLTDLASCRNTEELRVRPLIFICHSLGGIVFKKMLVLANDQSDLYGSAVEHVKAVLFLGVPHAGSDAASMVSFLGDIASLATGGNSNTELLNSLERDGKELYEISQAFVERAKRLLVIYSFVIYSFVELERTKGHVIVPERSAATLLYNEDLVPLDRNHSTVCKFESPTDNQFGRVLLKLQAISKQIAGLQSMPDKSSAALQEELLESLGKYSRNPRRYGISDEYQSTFEWIWQPNLDESKETGFVEWLESGSGSFWIFGKPGSGKSTLMKYIYEDQRTTSLLRKQDSDIKQAMFCFFEMGEPQEKEFLGFLRFLLYQLVDNFPSLAIPILKIFQEIKIQAVEKDPKMLAWSRSDTCRALKEISRQHTVTGKICLFVDALDECDEGAIQRDDIDYMVSLQSWKGITIKLCLSSRTETFIHSRLNKFPGFPLQAWTSNDIAKYVSQELKKAYGRIDAKASSGPDSKIIDSVVKKAEGVFLWVKLAVMELTYAIESFSDEEDILKLCALDERQGPLTLQSLYFVKEGAQKAAVRKIATIPVEVKITRCHHMRGHVAHCARNLIQVNECDRQWSLFADGPDDDESSVSSYSSDDGRNPNFDRLLEADVSFVHRSLWEYMKSDSGWSSVVQRANAGLLTDGLLSLMPCHLSFYKTEMGEVTTDGRGEGKEISVYQSMHYLIACIHEAAARGTLYSEFMDAMFTGFEQEESWQTHWFHREAWGCNSLADEFLGRSAWQYLVYEIYERLQYRITSSPGLELLTIALQAGAKMHQLIPQTSINWCLFPRSPWWDLSPPEEEIPAEKHAQQDYMPCNPLQLFLTSFNRLTIEFLVEVAKKMLEHGLDLQSQNQDGLTVLECSSRCRLRTHTNRNWSRDYGLRIDHHFPQSRKSPLVIPLSREDYETETWNLAPILLHLCDEIKDSSPKTTVLDLYRQIKSRIEKSRKKDRKSFPIFPLDPGRIREGGVIRAQEDARDEIERRRNDNEATKALSELLSILEEVG
ncbi:alpha/beta-Hydrolase [Glarea lozoyensis ATCC 20868]|uniref:Alpha/beta-Hydrolase n=1 Tax=Glarea lozoyensis (strain ATCC 20868 / MF5171) TaxID=1116229 RepID=S3D4U0_GLAL2|nr:alpha/beta-Hydrolase [Glarea lozoyensis ATCC 20868]EPE33467.1 alpha/beta-Hydrolase [Glarea lozoyensis ATCC 20868]